MVTIVEGMMRVVLGFETDKVGVPVSALGELPSSDITRLLPMSQTGNPE